MANSSFKPSKFSEELYFILMSPPMRPRLTSLAAKYDLSIKELRSEIIRNIDRLTYRITKPVAAEDYPRRYVLNG